MLAELDFIESDWAALLWAAGATTALFRHSVPRQLRTQLEKQFSAVKVVLRLKNFSRKTLGMASGVARGNV
jgi:hypothetical protein